MALIKTYEWKICSLPSISILIHTASHYTFLVRSASNFMNVYIEQCTPSTSEPRLQHTTSTCTTSLTAAAVVKFINWLHLNVHACAMYTLINGGTMSLWATFSNSLLVGLYNIEGGNSFWFSVRTYMCTCLYLLDCNFSHFDVRKWRLLLTEVRYIINLQVL